MNTASSFGFFLLFLALLGIILFVVLTLPTETTPESTTTMTPESTTTMTPETTTTMTPESTTTMTPESTSTPVGTQAETVLTPAPTLYSEWSNSGSCEAPLGYGSGTQTQTRECTANCVGDLVLTQSQSCEISFFDYASNSIARNSFDPSVTKTSSSISLSAPIEANKWTVSFYFNLKDSVLSSQWRNLISKAIDAATRDIQVSVVDSIIALRKSGVVYKNIPLPSPLGTDMWHNLVWVQNGDQTHIYIDNDLKTSMSKNIVNEMTWNTSVPLNIPNPYHVAHLKYFPFAVNESQLADLQTIFTQASPTATTSI